MRTSTRLTPMRGSTPPASSTVTLTGGPSGSCTTAKSSEPSAPGDGEDAAPHRSSHSADGGVELGHAVEEGAEIGVRVHARERRAAALEHGRRARPGAPAPRPAQRRRVPRRARATAAARRRRSARRAPSCASRSSRLSPELPRRITRRAISWRRSWRRAAWGSRHGSISSSARERLVVVGDGERRGRGVAKGQQVPPSVAGSGARARRDRARRSSQSASNVTSSGSPALSPVPRGSISTAPWPRAASARTSCTSARREPTASLASGETTSNASAASSGPSAYVNTGASGSPANAAVGITAKLWAVRISSRTDSPSDGGDPPHPTPHAPDSVCKTAGTVMAWRSPARTGRRVRASFSSACSPSAQRPRCAHVLRQRADADVPDVALTSLGTFASPLYVTVASGGSDAASSSSSAGARCASSRTASSSPRRSSTSPTRSAGGGERGLLSIAFAPDYAVSGLVYSFATQPNGTLVVWEHPRAPGADVADAGHFTVLSIPHSASNHNGGQLQFGPDGYLYIGVGDNADERNGQDIDRAARARSCASRRTRGPRTRSRRGSRSRPAQHPRSTPTACATRGGSRSTP